MILEFPHPMLSRVACPVGREDTEKEIEKMLEFIDGRVLGLAANQIGLNKHIAVINFPRAQFIMINPRIVARSVETTIDSESCLSLPGKKILTLRPKTVHVKFENRDRKEETLIASDYFAKCILHEIDHLNGIMMTARAA